MRLIPNLKYTFSRLFKLRWHSAILQFEALIRSTSRSEALRCCVLCNPALPPLSFTLRLCLWQTLQCIQDTFYLYVPSVAVLYQFSYRNYYQHLYVQFRL